METQAAILFKTRPYKYDCIQCNEDGQFVICLENNIHIMIPILTGATSKSDPYKHVGITLPTFTDTAGAKGTYVLEPEEIETSYLLEEGFRCARWSPIGISPSKSAFLLVITTKHRVLLYQDAAEKAGSTEWQMFVDLTEQIKKMSTVDNDSIHITPHHTLYGDWAKKLVSDPFTTNPSFFALCNKVGELHIWSYVDDVGVNHEATVEVHEGFVNLLDWTEWTRIDKSQYAAYIVSTSTDGTVALTSVKITLLEDENTTTYIEKVEANRLFVWFENDPTITSLAKITRCTEDGDACVKIVLSRGGNCHFLCLTEVADKELQPIQQEFSTYELKHSAMGLGSGQWITGSVFRCYTVEGEGLEFTLDKCGYLEMNEQQHHVLNTRLMQKYTQQWMDLQLEADEDSVLTAVDASPYLWGTADGSNHLYTAIYYSLKPDVDVYYRYESEENVAFSLISQKDRNADVDMSDLIYFYTKDPYFFFQKSIRGALWEILGYVLGDSDISSFIEIIEGLSKLAKESHSTHEAFIESIYCEPNTMAAMILINTKFLLENYSPRHFESALLSACDEARHYLQVNFLHKTLKYALESFEDTSGNWNEEDTTLVLLLCDLALTLRDRPLIERVAALYSKLQEKFPNISVQEEITYATTFETDSEPPQRKPREKCPVCEEYVHIIKDAIAQCNTGHFWEVCSLTQKVLSNPVTRKCSSCGAKTLSQPDNNEDTLVNFILKKCTKCIYCGSDLIVQRF